MQMLKAEAQRGPGGRVILMDSITKLTPEDEGALIVSGSHGGASSGEFALEMPLKVVFFNDAGVGKDDAGIAALQMLQARGIAAGTVAHSSGRIGDSRDMWENGEISYLNEAAQAAGLKAGTMLREALTRLVS
jgi:hypothetical protein